MKQLFSIAATTNGQKVFGPIALTVVPMGRVSIQGVDQDPLSGDFSISASFTITMANGVPLGQKIFGEIEI